MTLEIIHTKRSYVVRHENSIEQLCAKLAQAHATGTSTCADLTIAQVRLGKARDYSEGLEQQVENLNQLLDASAVGLADARRVALSYLRMATERKKKLDGYAAGWADACAARDALESSRDYWYKTCLDAEGERNEVRKEAQEQSDEVQRDWLSPAEAEGLRRQLAGMEAGRDFWRREYERNDKRLATAAEEAAIVKAAEALAMRLNSRLQYKVALTALQETLEHRSDAAAKLLERLAEAELAAHVLRESNFVLAQKVRTERAPRQEAEQETRRCNIALSAVRAEAKAAQVIAQNRGTRLEKAEQRAERAEALAALVTPELAELLERLADEVPVLRTAVRWAGRTHPAGSEIVDKARATAARIREALEANDEN